MAGHTLRALALGRLSGHGDGGQAGRPVHRTGSGHHGALPAGGWTFGATTAASGVTISPGQRPNRGRHRRPQLRTHFPRWCHHAPTSPSPRTSAARIHAPTGQWVERHVHPVGHRRRGHVHATRPMVSPSRQHRVPGELRRLQPRTDPPGNCAGHQAVGHQRTDVQQHHRAARVRLPAHPEQRHPPIGQIVSGFQAGQPLTIDETASIQRPLCTVTSRTVTLANGSPPTNGALPFSHDPERRTQHVPTDQRGDLHADAHPHQIGPNRSGGPDPLEPPSDRSDGSPSRTERSDRRAGGDGQRHGQRRLRAGGDRRGSPLSPVHRPQHHVGSGSDRLMAVRRGGRRPAS